jgi:hypothetical protein
LVKLFAASLKKKENFSDEVDPEEVVITLSIHPVEYGVDAIEA